VDEDTTEVIAWQAASRDGAMTQRHARLPRIIFMR
jgi:hypothetical protein